MTTKTTTKKKGRRKPPPKAQQLTSAKAIIRAKVKELALDFRLQGFTLRAMLPVINEAMGPGGDMETPGFVPYKSPHAISDMLIEAIRESVDPLKKEELLNLTIGQHNQLLAAAMGPALQGSIQHGGLALQVMDRLVKLTRIVEPEDGSGGGGPGITQIFLNGALANA